jgi:hypothetical protein
MYRISGVWESSIFFGIILRQGHFAPVRRLNAKQVVYKVVLAVVLVPSNAHPVVLAGDAEHVKVFVRFDESVDHLQRRGWVDVGIHSAGDDENLPL